MKKYLGIFLFLVLSPTVLMGAMGKEQEQEQEDTVDFKLRPTVDAITNTETVMLRSFWSKPAHRIQLGIAYGTGSAIFSDPKNGNQLGGQTTDPNLYLEFHMYQQMSFRLAVIEQLAGYTPRDSQGNAYNLPTVVSIPMILKVYPLSWEKLRPWIGVGVEYDSNTVLCFADQKTKSRSSSVWTSDRGWYPSLQIGLEYYLGKKKRWSIDTSFHTLLQKIPGHFGIDGREEAEVTATDLNLGISFHCF